MEFDPHSHRFPSARNVVYARGGMVCASQPLAAQAGLDMLKRGGNAVDAAVATAAALTAAEPTSNGIGGDAFALVWIDGVLHGLNASGPAPAALSLSSLKDPRAVAAVGWEPVTVPGAPSAWAALSRRFGKLPFGDLLDGAIRLASDGYPVSPTCAWYWGKAFARNREILTDPLFSGWFELFAPGGTPPAAGSTWKSPAHASTLESIARSGAESFYRGELASAIDSFSRSTGGFLRLADLEAFKPEWVEPLSVRYRGHDVWELPPNGQGMVALAVLGMLAGDDFGDLDEAGRAHLQIEALKLAFADASVYLADPASMMVDARSLLDPGYLASRRAEIGDRAMIRRAGSPERGGTVYLATADKDGCMVSFIQSNYMGFGSGLSVPGTGIALHNRGHNFSTLPGHPNALAPGKRPYHTIVPGFLTRDGQAIGPFGVMGGFMQPQGHVQVLSRCLDSLCNPQEALDAPRFQWTEGNRLQLEAGWDPLAAAALEARGHEVTVPPDSGGFGRGQVIWRTQDGTLCGATEKRTDGTVAAF